MWAEHAECVERLSLWIGVLGSVLAELGLMKVVVDPAFLPVAHAMTDSSFDSRWPVRSRLREREGDTTMRRGERTE